MAEHGFGDILDFWEEHRRGRGFSDGEAADFSKMIDRYPPSPASVSDEHGGGDAQEHRLGTRPHPRTLPIDAVLDLHGMTVLQAEAAVRAFLQESRRCGRRKVLFIHGKGNHSPTGAVLKNWLVQYLEVQRCAGPRGTAERKDGGSGALWVVLKD